MAVPVRLLPGPWATLLGAGSLRLLEVSGLMPFRVQQEAAQFFGASWVVILVTSCSLNQKAKCSRGGNWGVRQVKGGGGSPQSAWRRAPLYLELEAPSTPLQHESPRPSERLPRQSRAALGSVPRSPWTASEGTFVFYCF